jgi:ribonucleoside-diphosphate reductase alpha subunit
MKFLYCVLVVSQFCFSLQHYVQRQNMLPRSLASWDVLEEKIIELGQGLKSQHIDCATICRSVRTGVHPAMSVDDLTALCSETAAYMSGQHPDYGRLASRILVSRLHETTPSTFSEAMELLFAYGDGGSGNKAAIIVDDLIMTVRNFKELIDAHIAHDRDFDFDYFGYKTLERSYLLKTGDKIVERPQYMFMRVALGIHGNNLTAAFETYDALSAHDIIHASPTLFNAGTRAAQLSSCFLLPPPPDSIEGIYSSLADCAKISKGAGGIGLSISSIRSKGSYIAGTKGTSSGIVPMLRVFDATAKYVDQGGGKRPGAFAVYLEPWHADIFEFLLMKKNNGKEESRARDLFYGLWVPDLFMERVERDEMWSLMSPSECPGLDDCWGEDFNRKYTNYESQGKAVRTVRARDLWNAIMDSQMETGTPYMLYKDSCNKKSNQQHLGTIKCSNLCTEIIEYTSADEIAVCNLASIALPKCVKVSEGKSYFDFHKLLHLSGHLTRNLNRVIDINLYPVKAAENSNLQHRPIGIGVQGLADVFQMLEMPFDSEEARDLNEQIFETIYFGALDESCSLAERYGTYKSYVGSPVSRGVLQQDMWESSNFAARKLPSKWDWLNLRSRIQKHGLRNSLLVAPMPTASTAQILGNNECFEPFTRSAQIYMKKIFSIL